ncbi:hypothetical protein Moror_7932 [Moniliophthora roreri MCA 2997]|uniref:Tat pathway signal sequence n=2 Tax=Moniliophthora roreri TaxID=221103 RepID=V2X8C4_MONRO|nr:hypothetical protein Moror_7932 [Moniliophthora roreri MCA 2997]
MPRKDSESTDYAPLLQEDPTFELNSTNADPHYRNSRSKSRFLYGIVALQSIVIVVLLTLLSKGVARKSKPLLYSPVNHLLEEKTVQFHSAVGKDTTIYMGEPSPEVDKAWDDLYGFGVNRILKHEADQLPVKTVRISGDPSHYIVQLDVFHQLHCLNIIRKALHRDYYEHLHADSGHMPDSKEDEEQHVAHCIEHLRQSIVCASDVSTIVWQWIPERNQTMGRSGVPHTCKSFDKISEWASQPENRLHWNDFDLHVKPPDDDE